MATLLNWHSAPIIGTRPKNDEEAEKDITKQSRRYWVSFRVLCVFNVPGPKVDLPQMREISEDVGEDRDRLIAFTKRQGIELAFFERMVRVNKEMMHERIIGGSDRGIWKRKNNNRS